MKKRCGYSHSSIGFTLIEMVLSIALLGIVGVLTMSLFVESLSTFSLLSDRRESLEEARITVEKIKREVELLEETVDITTFTDTNFTFTLPSEGSISFTKSGSQILRNADVLSENVNLLNFDYLDQNGAETAVAADIRRIRFEVVIDSSQNHGSHRVRSQVFLRNLYYVDFQ